MKRVLKTKYIFVLILLISIGFAYLTSNLSLSGISNIFGHTWDVHFENIQITSGNVQANTPVISNNDTTVTFTVVLDMPGDFYEFTVDAVNGGTIDAMLDTYTSTTLTADQLKYLEYTATYADGEALAQYQELNAGDTLTYKIRLYYKSDIQEDDLPSENQSIEITFTTNYIQADENRIRRRAENSLYNVLKNEAESGGLAKKYTLAHKDSMDTSLSTKNIYNWYASNDTQGTQISDKDNVIFANHCWQMLRTTDTGGVKLIYNGEVENNQCLNTRGTHVGYAARTTQNLTANYWYGTDYTYDSNNKTFSISGTTEQKTWSATNGPGLIGKYTCKSTNINGTCETLYLIESYYNSSNAYAIPLDSNSHYSQFGRLQFNPNNNSLSYVGYMYNTNYPHEKRTMVQHETILTGNSINSSYWFADSVTYDGSNYSLNNPYQISIPTNAQDLVGKYTFRNSSQTYKSKTINYIAAVEESGTWIYYIAVTNNSPISLYNSTYTFGESYTDNGNGTYTINNPITINRLDWYSSYKSIGNNKYYCINATNNTCTDLRYMNYPTPSNPGFVRVSNTYKYSKGFTWDGSKYILDNNNSETIWNIFGINYTTKISNAHYTCWNDTGECTSLAYIFNIDHSGDVKPYYIYLTNGKNIETAINEMLYDNDVNSTNSIIKTGVEAWYKHYLLSDYDNYIEDTIYCNDRNVNKLQGWNPNGGLVTARLDFNVQNIILNIKCNNTTDQFSTSNNNAKLTYKVGLISTPELKNLNSVNIYKTGNYSWNLSPYYYDYEDGATSWTYGGMGTSTTRVSSALGVRPAISLKPGTVYSSGDGSMANPYVVDTN
ncbi:MAG: hypothetical protein IKP07_02965 [Bacilli bacterium]|nr:hypothetical protein [Bacilli bacterium]